MEVRWGLTPDVAGIALLRGLVRDDVARELAYSGRRFSGEEATRLGVVTRVAEDPRAEALAPARSIAVASPAAIRATKRLFNLSIDADADTILQAESREQEALLASAGHKETLAAAAAARHRFGTAHRDRGTDGRCGTWTPDGVAVRAAARDEAWRLDGVASYVLAGNCADTLLVVAQTGAAIRLSR
jgi:hypothetical protein